MRTLWLEHAQCRAKEEVLEEREEDGRGSGPKSGRGSNKGTGTKRGTGLGEKSLASPACQMVRVGLRRPLRYVCREDEVSLGDVAVGAPTHRRGHRRL